MKSLIFEKKDTKFFQIQPSFFNNENDFSFYLDMVFNDLNKNYPCFDQWLKKTVYPDLNNRFIVFAYHKNVLAGGFILKLNENKICSLFVKKEFRNLNIGSEFVNLSCSFIKGFPFLTVDKDIYLKFKPFFDKNKFVVINQKKGLYKKEKTEYFLKKSN